MLHGVPPFGAPPVRSRSWFRSGLIGYFNGPFTGRVQGGVRRGGGGIAESVSKKWSYSWGYPRNHNNSKIENRKKE